jgi:signal transduction histidine kinase
VELVQGWFVCLILRPALGHDAVTRREPTPGARGARGAVATLSVVPFHRVRDPDRLHALIEAMLLIEAETDLTSVLTDIVKVAVTLAGARYGALGVLDERGTGLADFVTVGLDSGERARIGALPEGRGILGLIIRHPEPLRLADLSEHPDSVGFPPNHPPMRSFLGVPVRVRGDVYGNLYLCDKKGAAEFTEEDADVVSALGMAAGLVIDKARLHARLRELTLAEERERMARNLHDTVIQRLFAVGLGLQGMARLVSTDEGRQRTEELIDELDATVRQIRTTIFAISRARRTASSAGLRREILDVVDEAAGRLGLDVGIDFEGPIDTAVGPTTGEHLLFSLREALSNVVRHARASHAEVQVVVSPDGLELRVADDGVGVTPGDAGSGRGLANLKERAKLLGGLCEIRSRLDGGSELLWSVREL